MASLGRGCSPALLSCAKGGPEGSIKGPSPSPSFVLYPLWSALQRHTFRVSFSVSRSRNDRPPTASGFKFLHTVAFGSFCFPQSPRTRPLMAAFALLQSSRTPSLLVAFAFTAPGFSHMAAFDSLCSLQLPSTRRLLCISFNNHGPGGHQSHTHPSSQISHSTPL